MVHKFNKFVSDLACTQVSIIVTPSNPMCTDIASRLRKPEQNLFANFIC